MRCGIPLRPLENLEHFPALFAACSAELDGEGKYYTNT